MTLNLIVLMKCISPQTNNMLKRSFTSCKQQYRTYCWVGTTTDGKSTYVSTVLTVGSEQQQMEKYIRNSSGIRDILLKYLSHFRTLNVQSTGIVFETSCSALTCTLKCLAFVFESLVADLQIWSNGYIDYNFDHMGINMC